MLFCDRPHRGLAALVTACMLTVALPVGAAWAQKIKNPAPEVSQPAPAEVTTTQQVEIDTIEAVDSNLDEATLREIFSGNIADNAEALASLSATSITIPAINVRIETTSGDNDATQSTVVFNDLVLTDVVNGVAATVSLGGTTVESEDEGSAQMGAMTAATLDIGAVLGLYGLVQTNPSNELTPLYTNFNFEGGSFKAPEVSCTMGPITMAEVKGRPLRHSMAEFMALSSALDDEDEDDETPSPELMGAALRMYADIFTAFETSPAQFGGFDCNGVDDEDRPLTVGVKSMSMAGLSPGIYPEITIEGMTIAVEGDGHFEMGRAVFKQIDLAGPIAAIEAAPEAIDQAWLDANARALVPAFTGFSLEQISVDVPDPEDSSVRIKGSLGAFDLALAEYRNGIPTDFLMSATNLAFALPEDTSDPQLAQLRALGVTDIDAGFKIAAAWNEATSSIDINEISVTGADLATIVMTGTLTNATAALFDLDADTALAAGMELAVGKLNVDVSDQGLTDIIFAAVAAEQGTQPEALRPIFAGLAEGTIVGLLAGAADAQNVGRAINTFVSGQAKNLNIDVVAKEPGGVSVVDFMAAEEDPKVLIDKVTIKATAQ
ncbi:hypothetical protein [Devosia sp. 1566]|uniref:hypothetical protein n=1 Tax=Devosia sp. 1566 TaxID=2499144 RepID=UPI000FD9266B|nr:hypothetical protein [Devosia sp. 1566]